MGPRGTKIMGLGSYTLVTAQTAYLPSFAREKRVEKGNDGFKLGGERRG
jgi:hypothetical protein